MPLHVETLTEAPPDWNAFVEARGSFYHRAEWADALARQFRFPMHYLTARMEGRLVGVLPLARVRSPLGKRRLVSLPFSYAVGPLAISADVDAALADAARALAAAQHVRTLELKRRDIAATLAAGFTRVSQYLTYVVPPDGGPDAVWKRLHPSHVQRGIKKGLKTVTVERGADRAAWARMAELQQRTSHRLGLPAPPARFFTEGCRALQARGLADLLLARVPGGAYAAGIVLWKGGAEVIYAFGASLPQHLEHRPTHVLLWTAAREAALAGLVFDLGRASPQQEGLTAFKLRWGGVPRPLAYDYWPAPAGLNTMSRGRGVLTLLNKAWTRLPFSVTRHGSFLYRYLG